MRPPASDEVYEAVPAVLIGTQAAHSLVSSPEVMKGFMWIITGFQQALDPEESRRFYWGLLHPGSSGLGEVLIKDPELSARRLYQVVKDVQLHFRCSQVRLNRGSWILLGSSEVFQGTLRF